MDAKPVAPSLLLVAIAFATLYIVWGSTYLVIAYALEGFPTTILGAFRFGLAGIIMLIYCIIKRKDVWNWQVIKRAAIVGLFLLFIGNETVVFAENTISSSLAAIVISAAPIWFVLLDSRMWSTNFKDPATLLGLGIGFVGVILLFYDSLHDMELAGFNATSVLALMVVLIGCLFWARGSIYNKYNSLGGPAVNIAWQMIAASLAFGIASVLSGEAFTFSFADVSENAFWSLMYLVGFGSIAAYTAYIWLLSVRPITQVSTYAYINPVIAVLFGVLLADEHITTLQYAALVIILLAVLLVNLNKYRKGKKLKKVSLLNS